MDDGLSLTLVIWNWFGTINLPHTQPNRMRKIKHLNYMLHQIIGLPQSKFTYTLHAILKCWLHHSTRNPQIRFSLWFFIPMSYPSYEYSYTMELSFNSSCLLVGSWLFCLQNLPCLVSVRCMCWESCGLVEVWTKNILYWFIEGQTHFSNACGAKIECSTFKPPHDLQHMYLKLIKHGSKTTNSLLDVTMN